VRDRSGEVIGLHRTYLPQGAETRSARRPMAKPKMMLGRIAGGAVRLGPVGPDGRVGLCEGIETGLAVMTARPDLPVWATLSTSGLEQVDLPPAAQRVLILADNDASGAGTARRGCRCARLRAQGATSPSPCRPRKGQDFNDLLLSDGAQRPSRALIAEADSITRPRPFCRSGSTGRSTTRAGETIPTLRADEGDLGRSVAQAWSVIMASNRTPWVYRFAGQPTWVVPDDEGRPVATMLNEERLRHMLARLARWVRVNAKGEPIPAPPPCRWSNRSSPPPIRRCPC
jgi:putative DNA primase/helicase